MSPDTVFFLGSLVFMISLVPAVFAREKPPLSTSIPTGMVLAIFAATYATMAFWLSAGITMLTATFWLTLAVQKGIRGLR